jgi:two-component system chemotaxis response regulator CheB
MIDVADYDGDPFMVTHDLIVIGTSSGGFEALRTLAGGLPKNFPAAILIVIHLSPQSPYVLPLMLSRASQVVVAETVDKTRIEPGKIYIAPPDHHMLVEGSDIRLTKGPKENRFRPAIDPLFRTAASSYGPRVVGVILTGMLDDGTAGLAVVKEHGGITVVQDPKDALYPSMPQSALRYVGAHYVLPLSEMALLLAQLTTEPVGASETSPGSRLNEIESRFAQMKPTNFEDMQLIGSHAGISCPECYGTMWKITEGIPPRYRCHVGHAYTAQSLVDEQKEKQENYLWQALRLMKERTSLVFEMKSHAEQNHREEDIASCDAKIRQLQKNIAQLQKILKEEEP